MSTIFHYRQIAASRKRRRCDWCAESIEIGEPYEAYRWRDGCEAGAAYMHPECIAACQRLARDPDDPVREFTPGEFARGAAHD